jgi:toxin ParE1/3/4
MAERRVVVRPRAADDIVEIFATIAHDDLRAAERFEAAVRRECGLLATFPHLGRARGFRSPDLQGLRSRPISGFGSWLLFYRITADAVEIVRLLHGARDLPNALRS